MCAEDCNTEQVVGSAGFWVRKAAEAPLYIKTFSAYHLGSQISKTLIKGASSLSVYHRPRPRSIKLSADPISCACRAPHIIILPQIYQIYGNLNLGIVQLLRYLIPHWLISGESTLHHRDDINTSSVFRSLGTVSNWHRSLIYSYLISFYRFCHKIERKHSTIIHSARDSALYLFCAKYHAKEDLNLYFILHWQRRYSRIQQDEVNLISDPRRDGISDKLYFLHLEINISI